MLLYIMLYIVLAYFQKKCSFKSLKINAQHCITNIHIVKSIAYKILVHPQLEYASEVWNPYIMKCINKIEQIQRNSSFMNTVVTDTSLLIN